MSLYSLIDTAKRIMLEDTGLSADPVAANNVKDGQVASLGVEPSGEPPGVSSALRRRRRKRRLQRHARRRREFRETQLYRDMDVPYAKIDLADYDFNGNLLPVNECFSPVNDEVQLLEQFRADEVIGTGRPERSPKAGHFKRRVKKLRGGAKIIVNPDHALDETSEDLLAPLVCLGLGGYRDVISDIDGALDDPAGREQLGELCSRLFGVLRNDPTAFNRTRQLLREGG